MNYYKLIWDNKPTLKQIPGFVWPNQQTAKDHYDNYCQWTTGNTEHPNLYEITTISPYQFPLAFDGRMCYNPNRPQTTTLTINEITQALTYFNSKPIDFFGSADATEDDIQLFLQLAKSVGPPKTAPNPNLDEYFIGYECTMTLCINPACEK